MSELSDERLLAEIDALIRLRPEQYKLGQELPEAWDWLGRCCALLRSWDQLQSAGVGFLAERIQNGRSEGYQGLMLLLHQARNDLQLRTSGPTALVFGQGQQFSYFDDVRKLIELASSDLLFVDRYLEAEFVSRYLEFVKPGVVIRLLTRRPVAKLLPAVQMFVAQTRAAMKVRTSDKFHDRFLFVDRASAYFSGGSFKDGGDKSPVLLAQVTDAFTGLHMVYEDLWSSGAVEFE